jgi:excisionase family DNA binding protein
MATGNLSPNGTNRSYRRTASPAGQSAYWQPLSSIPPGPALRATGEIEVSLAPETASLIAQAVAEALADQQEQSPGAWLNVASAAEYLDCPRSRIYDLKDKGRLLFAQDGKRLLFRREWLDGALERPEPDLR